MLPVHTILYPTDLSGPSRSVFPVACALARDHGARLIVLHVELPPLGAAEVVAHRDPDKYYAGVWEELRKLQAPGSNILVEHQLTIGDAAAEILRVAEDSRAGLIIMGTHGRTGLGRVLLGSVAEAVLRLARCPVLTVKSPAAEAAPKPTLADQVSATSVVAG